MVEDIIQYHRKWRKNLASMEDIFHYWLSSTILANAVTWKDQNKDGKTNKIFKIKRKRP
jgi:hypothetical protein